MSQSSGVNYTYYCFTDGTYGSPLCTDYGGTQGHCPAGYTQKLYLGSWGWCFIYGWYVSYAFPPGGGCGSRATASATIGSEYVCSQ